MAVKRKRQPWTDAQLALLREIYPNMMTAKVAELVGHTLHSTYQTAQRLSIKKSPVFLRSDESGQIKRGATKGARTRFTAGSTPWNKGQAFDAGGRSVETRFAPGLVPHNHAPIGSTRVTTEGYLQRKVTETGYPPRDWVSVHKLLWEAAHGPVPLKHLVVFKPGRHTTVEAEVTLDALECITRGQLLERNSVRNLPPDVREAIHALGSLRRVINHRSKA